MRGAQWHDLLGDRHFYRQMFSIAIPVALQQLITVGINLMDTIMLSHMGDAQLSAASLAGQFVNMFHIFSMGIGMGASVLTARYWGMRDLHSLRKSITIMLRLCAILITVFAAATLISPAGIMALYTPDAEIINLGCTYLAYMVPCFLCLGLSNTVTIVLRTARQVRIPLVCSICAFFINIFFNWVFIFGNLGAPRMEIAGAALGTLLARIFELLFICGYFFFKDERIGYRLRHLALPCRDLVGEYFRTAIPVLISDGLLALGNNAVSMIMGRIGRTFVAANSVTSIVQQLSTVLIQGICHASGIITGNTLGEGDKEKAQQQAFSFLGTGIILGLLASLLIYIVKMPLINFYQVSEETRMTAMELMDAIALIVFFQSINSILTKGVLRAGGDTRFLMAGDVLFLWVASIPLGILAGLVLHWPAFWIYMMIKIDQILKCIWSAFRLQSGKWIKVIGTSKDGPKEKALSSTAQSAT